MRDARRILALAAWCAIILLWTPAVHAHATLVTSDPVDGAVLSNWPAHAALRFNEPVSSLAVRLVMPDGATQTLGRVDSRGNTLEIELPVQTAQGTYALSWRVVSADGHPIGGTIVYSLGQAGVTRTDEVHDPLREPAIWLARVALYVGLFVGVGGAGFHAFMRGASVGGTVWSRRAAWLGIAVAPVCLMLQGLDALNAPWRDMFDVYVWRAALTTTYALTIALTVGALVIALVALHVQRSTVVRASAGMAVLLLGVALAASGHASAAPPQWLARPAVLLHGIAIAAWLGALLPLVGLTRNGNVAPTLRAFSRGIPIAVSILVLSGVVLALLQIDAFASLRDTAYGRILLLKLLLVVCLFLLAAGNRYRLTGRVLNGDSGARRALGRVIVIEIAVALCVLGVVALWRFTPPPRALAATAAPSVVTAQLRESSITAEVRVTPVADRPDALRLMLTDDHGAPLSPRAVTVWFANSAQGVEPLARDAVPLRPGVWEVKPLGLPAAEQWEMRIDVLVTDFDRIRLEGQLDLSAAGVSH